MQRTLMMMAVVILFAALLAWVLAGFLADALTSPLHVAAGGSPHLKGKLQGARLD